MAQSSNNPQWVTLKFPDGKTVTLSWDEYQAQLTDPLVEVNGPHGTQIMPESQFKALREQQVNQYMGQMAAAIDVTFATGRQLETHASTAADIGNQVQATFATLIPALGFGNKASDQAKPQLEQAAQALQKGFGAIVQSTSGIGGGLVTASSMLLQNDQATVAAFGRTVTDPRAVLNKLIAMDNQLE